MNRREFLQCATLLISGAAASRLGFALTDEQQHFMAAANYNAAPVSYFTESARRCVAAIAETIIPASDTPGAIDAGVPRYIELMVADWFDDSERAIFNDGLKALMDAADLGYGRPFFELKSTERVAMLEALEDQAGDSPWYQLGNIRRDFISDAPFICQIKELTIWGFFTSEVGGTQVLRYEAMPMKFDGNSRITLDESSWVATYP